MSLSGNEPATNGRVGRPQCLIAASIVLLEGCALVSTALMLWLLVRYAWAKNLAAHQLTSQSARGLQYWATLLYVHALAWAWFRRAGNARSALLGFAGILYMGCGYVFSLALASLVELCRWPEILRMVCWIVILPLLAWVSLLAGCFLLWGAIEAGYCPADARPQLAADRPRLRCRGLVPLLLAGLIAATLLTAAIGYRTAVLLAAWWGRDTAGRSMDFLGFFLYALVYLALSLAVLATAVVWGRRALRNNDPELLWRAGALAIAGGLQHFYLIGLPAVVGGILATRAANRHSDRTGRPFWRTIRQSLQSDPP